MLDYPGKLFECFDQSCTSKKELEVTYGDIEEFYIDLNLTPDMHVAPELNIKLKLNLIPKPNVKMNPYPIPKLRITFQYSDNIRGHKRKRSEISNSSTKKRKVEKHLFTIPGYDRRFGIIHAIVHCAMNGSGSKIKHDASNKSVVLEIDDFSLLVNTIEDLRTKPNTRMKSDTYAALLFWFEGIIGGCNFKDGIGISKDEKYDRLKRILRTFSDI